MHTALAEATKTLAMRVPASLGVVEDVGLDLVTAVDGGSLYQSLGAGSDAPLISRVVRALAELHERVPGFADRVHGPAGELELVRSWVEWMSKVEPSIEGRLRRSLAILVAEAPTTTPNGFAHRDFHDKQVLLGEANLWLLDVDTACTGDAELDLGNFLAHLFLRGVQWQRALDHSHLETIAVQSYGDRARADVTRWYRRASLLRLACVYQLRPRWRAIVPALLGETLIP